MTPPLRGSRREVQPAGVPVGGAGRPTIPCSRRAWYGYLALMSPLTLPLKGGGNRGQIERKPLQGLFAHC